MLPEVGDFSHYWASWQRPVERMWRVSFKTCGEVVVLSSINLPKVPHSLFDNRVSQLFSCRLGALRSVKLVWRKPEVKASTIMLRFYELHWKCFPTVCINNNVYSLYILFLFLFIVVFKMLVFFFSSAVFNRWLDEVILTS